MSRTYRKFDTSFKLSVVQEYLNGASQYSLSKKYSIDWSLIHKWIRIFAPEYHPVESIPMGKKQSESLEIQALKRALREKELELSRERMRADFYETMVEVAEEQFNIEIRKKAGTNQ